MSRNLHVVCVCCGFGFPEGMAVTSRIKMFGKALIEEGVKFSVFHVGGSYVSNDVPRGVWEKIEFEYFPMRVRSPGNALFRKFCNLAGLVKVLVRLVLMRRTERICIHTWEWPLADFLFGLFGFTVVLQVNEWWPGRQRRATFCQNKSSGTVVISSEIEKRLSRMLGSGKERPFLRVPILIDAYAKEKIRDVTEEKLPYFFWCGSPQGDGWRDICFLIDGVHQLYSRGGVVKMVLAGLFTEAVNRQLEEYMELKKIPTELVEVIGFISEDELHSYMHNASALMLPLWDDDERSICRFPTKLGEYLMSGTPVVTARVGDVSLYVHDREECFCYRCGDLHDFSVTIESVLNNVSTAKSVGQRGMRRAAEMFDYRMHSSALAAFFDSMT